MTQASRHIITLLVILGVFLHAELYSQEKPIDEHSMKNYKLEPNDRLILEVNHTSWLGYPPNITATLPSIGVNFALMFDKAIGNSNFTFGYGLGLFSHNFHSNADFLYVRDSLGNRFNTKLEPYNRPVSLNRYAEKILEVPVELRFRTKTDRQFKIHIGGKIGYVINDFRSIKDNDGKIRVYNIKNVNRLRYGLNFRIGFEQVALCATYYLSEVFENGRGPAGIHQFALGIAIIPY